MFKKCMINWLLALTICMGVNLSYGDELITGFADQEETSVPVLNEELRKLRKTGQGLRTSIDSLTTLVETEIAAIEVPPVGSVVDYAGSTAPTGWLLCDGSAVSRTTYADLFTVIGTTYGAGDGSNTFNVPNAKGRTTIGAGQGSTYANGVDAAGTNFALAASDGKEKHVLTVAELATHSHSLSGGSLVVYDSGDGWISPWVDEDYKLGGGTIGNAGSNTAHNNLQPYLVLNKIIKT